MVSQVRTTRQPARGRADRAGDALLVCLQLADSAFPSGFYTLSHGLEGYAQAGAVTADTVHDLLVDLLRHGVGPADATALALAHRAARRGDVDTVLAIDRRLHAAQLSREIRVAATRTGRQLLDLARALFPHRTLERYAAEVAGRSAPAGQPVVAGVVYAVAGVDAHAAVTAELFAFCASFTGAALRLRLADHRGAQRVLRAAAPVIDQVAAEACRRDLADLGGCTPMADVMSARHERAQAHLFAS